MTLRTFEAGERRATAEGDWAKLSTQFTKAADQLASEENKRGKLTPLRKDIVVTITPGAGGGSKARFSHDLGEIEIDGDNLEMYPDPRRLEPAKFYDDRNLIPATWGLLAHEVAHAVHTKWKKDAHAWWQARPKPTLPWAARVLDAASLIEEPRVESRQVGRRPWDKRYLRMSASTHLLGEMQADQLQMRYAAMRVVALVGGRLIAGILSESEARPVLNKAQTILGDMDFTDAMDLMQESLNSVEEGGVRDDNWNDDEYGLQYRAESWVKILDRTPESEMTEERQQKIMAAVQKIVDDANEQRKREQEEKEERERQRRQMWQPKSWRQDEEKDDQGSGGEESDDEDDESDDGDGGEGGQDGDQGDGDDSQDGDGNGDGQDTQDGDTQDGNGQGQGSQGGVSQQPAGGQGMPGGAGPSDGTSAAAASAGEVEDPDPLTEAEQILVELLADTALQGGKIIAANGWREWTPQERAEAFKPAWKPVTAEQRRAVNALKERMEEWILPERSVGRNDNEMPPGRLNGRMAQKRQAERAAGAIPSAPQWRHVSRKTVPTPPLRAAMVVDVSGSMDRMAPVSREIAYRFGEAFRQLPDALFRGYLAGEGVEPWQFKPGQVPYYQYHHGEQNSHLALKELVPSLGLMKRGNARLVVIISDGNNYGEEVDGIVKHLDRVLNTGGHVLWISFAERYSDSDWQYDRRIKGARKVPECIWKLTAPLHNFTYQEVSLTDPDKAVTMAEDVLVDVMKGWAVKWQLQPA